MSQNLLCWNARGVTNPTTKNYLKNMLQLHNIGFCIISEPKSPSANLHSFASSLGFDHSYSGSNPQAKIWIMWKDLFDIHPLWESDQHITIKVESCNFSFYCSCIYASTAISERRTLWADLISCSAHNQSSWLLMGDYNAILSWNEKKGGDRRGINSNRDFNNFLNACGLSDAGHIGTPFTWCNNQVGNSRVVERLDRVLLNGEAMLALPKIQVKHLERVCSDHNPLLVSFMDNKKRPYSFKFMRMWTEHPNFHEVVSTSWDEAAEGTPMHRFVTKLARLKKVLKTWNWTTFGNINQKISKLKVDISHMEDSLDAAWDEELNKELFEKKGDLSHLLNFHTTMLAEKANLKWVLEGDRNSKLFHAAIKARRNYNTCRIKRHDGSFFDDDEQIGAAAVQHFQNIIGTFPECISNLPEDIIQPCITELQDSSFSRVPAADEIKRVVFEINPNSAPGPDGFSALFYQQCWSVICNDLTAAITDFFRGGSIPRSIAATNLVLIPKEKNANCFDQLRPISLCNVLHKIISKIMNDRLLPLLTELISPEQTGFIPGRSIHDNIGLAQDLAKDINKKARGGNIIFKIDLAKAYDKLSWTFIIKVLRCFGFSHLSCDLIFRNLSSNWYSVLWDGLKYGFFRSHRGVRQGDPMSPTIFILAMEFFSRMLNQAYSSGKIGFYSTKSSSMHITHIMYADDLLIFANGHKNSIQNLSTILDDFCKLSGLSINRQKSNMFLSKHIPPARTKILMENSNFKEGRFPFKYLGAYIFKGRNKCSQYTYLEEAIKNKLSGWMKSFLSMAGRVTLIQSVLNSICLHTLAVMPVPKKNIKCIQSLIANFLWDNGKEKKKHWISWNTICKPRCEGGLGLRSVQTFQKLLLAKLAWKFITNETIWMKFIRSKKTKDGFDSFIWQSIKPHVLRHRRESSWVIGNGESKLGYFGEWFRQSIPKRLQNLSLKEIHDNPILLGRVLNCFPGILHSMFIDLHFTDDKDTIIWRPSRSGKFSVKAFYDHCRISSDPIHKFSYIWQRWLPPKFSIFMWKLIHQRLPTDDKVISLGIQIVSKCSCCNNPSVENMEHLFFQGQEATALWSSISPALGQSVPTSLDNFINHWIHTLKKKDFVTTMCFTTGILCLWMLWFFRNKARMEGLHINCLQGAIKWTRKIAHHLPLYAQSDTDTAVRNICSFFQLSQPVFSSNHNRICWCPHPWGYTMSCTINVKHQSLFCGFVIRNHVGDFLYAACFSVCTDLLLPAIEHIFFRCNQLIPKVNCIESSHPDMECLANDSSPWENMRLWRRFKQCLPHVKMKKITHTENNLATVLSYLGKDTFIQQATDLPLVAMKAFIFDRRQLCIYRSSRPI